MINYSLLAEGIAERFAIRLMIDKIGKQHNCSFRLSSTQISQSANPSKSRVYTKISAFASQSLSKGEDLFMVGVDLDEADFENEKWKKEEEKIKNLLPKKTNHVIIFIPVQAFDYWLLYQNYQIDKQIEKPAPNSLESKSKEKAKQELYGDKTPNRAKIQGTCQKIIEKIDLEELSTQSKSFQRFYEAIIDFIRQKI